MFGVVVDVLAPSGSPLGKREHPVKDSSAGADAMIVDVAAARLAVRWDSLTHIDAFDSLHVHLWCRSHSYRSANAVHDPDRVRWRRQAIEEGRADLGILAAGEYAVFLRLYRIGICDETGSMEFSKRVSCRAGELSECVFTDADRVKYPVK